jgi:hypothetical protein
MSPNEKIKQMINDPMLMQSLEDKFMRKRKRAKPKNNGFEIEQP